MAGSTREWCLIDQTAHYHASGGNLDALVEFTYLGTGGLRIEDGANGMTRLYYAARFDWCSAAKILLENGADVHLGRPSHGMTPLHIAATWDRRDAAVLLLDAGARVNDCDQHGWTALHFAAGHNHPQMCKLLMSRGASLDARNNGGDDPEVSACNNGRWRTANLLAAVRAAGGWQPYVDAPRKELLALRQRLPALRDRGRAAPSSSVRAHERLFLKVPDDVFSHVLAFWRSDRDD
jgi:hypothetical protein